MNSFEDGDLIRYKYSTYDAQYFVVKKIMGETYFIVDGEGGPYIPAHMYDDNNLTLLAPRSILAWEE